MSNTPARPCTTTVLLWQNALSWISTPSATCLNTSWTRLLHGRHGCPPELARPAGRWRHSSNGRCGPSSPVPNSVAFCNSYSEDQIPVKDDSWDHGSRRGTYPDTRRLTVLLGSDQSFVSLSVGDCWIPELRRDRV